MGIEGLSLGFGIMAKKMQTTILCDIYIYSYNRKHPPAPPILHKCFQDTGLAASY